MLGYGKGVRTELEFENGERWVDSRRAIKLVEGGNYKRLNSVVRRPG